MRAFMRALGLGGLFKSSSSRAASAPTSDFGMRTLVPVEQPTFTTSQIWNARDSRRRSSVDRQPFLFFCGSEGRGRTSSSSSSSSLRLSISDLGHPDSIPFSLAAANFPKLIHAPMISHRMPVFFVPPPVAVYPRVSPLMV